MFNLRHASREIIQKIIVIIVIVNSFDSLIFPPVLADDNQLNGLLALSTDEIKSVLINSSVTGLSPESGFSFTVFYPAYSKLEGEAGLWGFYQDEGSWSVNEGIYCARWDNWLDNAERCYRVYLDDDAIYWVTLDGILQSKDTLLRKQKSE